MCTQTFQLRRTFHIKSVVYVLAIENEAVIFSLVLEELNYCIDKTGISKYLIYSYFLSSLVEAFLLITGFLQSVLLYLFIYGLKNANCA